MFQSPPDPRKAASRAFRLRSRVRKGETLPPDLARWLEDYETAHPPSGRFGKGRASSSSSAPPPDSASSASSSSSAPPPASSPGEPPPLPADGPTAGEGEAGAPGATSPEERQAYCQTVAGLICTALRAGEPTIKAAGLMPLPAEAYPIIEGAAARLADKHLPADFNSGDADGYVVGGAAAYQAINVIVAKRKLAAGEAPPPPGGSRKGPPPPPPAPPPELAPLEERPPPAMPKGFGDLLDA